MNSPAPRTSEQSTMLLGVATTVALVVCHLATRDALFLTNFDVLQLPQVLGVGAVLALLVALPVSRAVAARGPESVMRGTLLAGAALLLVAWWLAGSVRREVAFGVYVWSEVQGAIVSATFGVLTTERLGLRRLRHRRGAVLGAVVAGAVVGGLLVAAVGTQHGVRAMLPAIAALQIAAAFLPTKLGKGSRSASEGSGAVTRTAPTERPVGGANPVQTFLHTPYLRTLALVLLLAAACAVPFDYALKARAAAHFLGGEDLLRFFAVLYGVVGLAGFWLQGTLGNLALERMGLAGTLAAVPGAALVGGGALLLLPGIASATLARGAELVAFRSLFRPAYALLYTPVPAASRRAVRTLIEVPIDRLGAAAAGGLVLLMATMAPTLGMRSLALLAIGLALLAGFAVRRLQVAYVRALEQSLVGRAVQIDDDSVQDRTTRTLVESLRAADLQRAWHESSLALPIAELRRLMAQSAGSDAVADAVASGPRTSPERTISTAESPAPVPAGESQPAGQVPRRAVPSTTLRALEPVLAELRSGDAERIQRALDDTPALDRALVPYVVPFLARDDVAPQAVEALKRVAPQVTGMLVDMLLDPEEPLAVRRRLPRVIATAPSARAVEGLLHGLEDSRTEVRLQCGRALARMHVARPEIAFERERVMGLVLAEARRGKRVWEGQQMLETAEEREDSPLVDEVLRDRANRSLEHVFTLLSLVLPLEPLRIAFAGLHTDDPALRHTALAYVDSVLPPEVRSSLWPLLAERGVAAGAPQPAREALADLMGANQSMQINLAELRRRLQQNS